MRACVSPPQLSVSHMVEVAAIVAQAASTALPPRAKISAPAVAPSGLPVMAIQWRPWRGGFAVRGAGWARALGVAAVVTATANTTPARLFIARMVTPGRCPRGTLYSDP